jgi:aerobic C4-dicarboxylate transport protein
MSEARALTNLIGNGVATVVVGRMTGDLDAARLQRQLNNESEEDAEEPEAVLDRSEASMTSHVSAAPLP